MPSPKSAGPCLALPTLANGPPFCTSAESRHRRPSRLPPHEQHKTDVPRCLITHLFPLIMPSQPMCPVQPLAWWHQQMLRMFYPCCKTSVRRRSSPTATVFVPRLSGTLTASTTARRPVCEVPGAATSWSSLQREESPASPPSLSPRVACQTVRPVAPASVDMKCRMYIFQLGSICPKELCWFLRKRLKSPVSNKINKPAHPWLQNFLQVPYDQVRPCWILITVRGPKVSPKTYTSPRVCFPEERSPKACHLVPKDCGKS